MNATTPDAARELADLTTWYVRAKRIFAPHALRLALRLAEGGRGCEARVWTARCAEWKTHTRYVDHIRSIARPSASDQRRLLTELREIDRIYGPWMPPEVRE